MCRTSLPARNAEAYLHIINETAVSDGLIPEPPACEVAAYYGHGDEQAPEPELKDYRRTRCPAIDSETRQN